MRYSKDMEIKIKFKPNPEYSLMQRLDVKGARSIRSTLIK